MAILGCQPAHLKRPPEGREVAREETQGKAGFRQNHLQGMQGVADLELSGQVGPYRGKGIFSLELPDRFRWESLNLLGFGDFIVCSDGQGIDLYLPSERKVIRGKPIPAQLGRFLGAEASLSCLLRILMGQPPLSSDGTSPPWVIDSEVRESAEGSERTGAMRQRLGRDDIGQEGWGGEILDEQGVWLSFQCKDVREIRGFTVPHRLDLDLKRKGVRVKIAYREVRTSPSFDADAFRLSIPLTDQIAILDMEDSGSLEDSPN
jgi:hypothetical protein